MAHKRVGLLSAEAVEEIEELFREVFTHEPWNDDWSDAAQLRRYMLDLIANPNSLALGLFVGDDLLGLSLGEVVHWYSGTEYHIREFCIRRDVQGRGLGRAFMALMEPVLGERAIHTVILATDLDKDAYRFYCRNGFRELDQMRFLYKAIR